ncbi:MAG: zinc ribbon domain-containing protein [Polyangiaceae bacterium]
MSIPDQIRALERLAQIDAELKELQERLSQERATLEGLKSSISKLDEKLAGDRAGLGSMEKMRSELMLDVRNMNQQLEHSREKLSRSRTEREANAAQRELEELRKLIRDREDEITKLSASLDSSSQLIEAAEGEHKKLVDDLGAREGDISSKVGEAEGKVAEKEAERAAALKALPPVLYRRYETIRLKRVTAVARTTDGTCQACHMALPPQLFHRLRREPLLEQCPSCHRIIYFVAPESGNASVS